MKLVKEENLISELLYLPDAFIDSIGVDCWMDAGDYFIYVLSIRGRTRFLHFLHGDSKIIKYKAYARYNKLKELNETIKTEVAPHIAANEALGKMPAFPGKKWLGNDRELAEKRVGLFNTYFGDLFNRFGHILRYSQMLINDFAPVKIDVTFTGCTKEELNKFLNMAILMQCNMDLTEEQTMPSSSPEQKIVLCGVKPLADYSTLLQEITKTGSAQGKQWKKYVPFDYLREGNLYRIDIQKMKEPLDSNTDMELLFQNPVVFLIDLLKKESYEGIKQVLEKTESYYNDKKKCPPCFVIAGINSENINRVISSSDISKLLTETVADKVPFKYSEVNSTTGEGIFMLLNELLVSFCATKHASKSE